MSSPTFGCTDVPVVIRWGDTQPYNYIGMPMQHLRMNIDLGTQSSPKLLFWFSVTVGVTASPESATIRTKLLHFVIQASSLDFDQDDTCLALENPYAGYSRSTSAVIREAGICSDHASVSRICFELHDHGRVFMPPVGEHPFTPVSDNVSQLLVNMQSLSQAKQFWVYTSLEKSLLANIWKRIDQIRRGTFTSDFTTQSVYKHGMVCDEWASFNLSVRKGKRVNPAKGQGAGMERKDKDSDRLCESGGVSSNNLPSSDRDQSLVDTESGEKPHTELKRKYSKISSDTTPSGILKDITSPTVVHSNKSCADHQIFKVRFAEPHSEVRGRLEEQLAAFIRWVLEIDSHLEEDCAQVFTDLGRAVSRGDQNKFIEIKSDCMANIYCTYVKRGSEWVLMNTI
ncbi:hypothetical protein SS1G_07047 [Sclerotinia sclerotiorum 1980 UF-70]|uniref:Uncharacterized protein n=2 Tax=Sclerotinia sclerotiorum (strain ATCC 18683 / 1980 / Ss-1) TaxID=665079 RepID=A7ENZ8_SCLS1|nr:hypothetical protein SS1G_07047 [Sclerotinia sclerotiorum 1980 UF-70]APA10453.1 hypothetical protein sscle_06g052230 [Sclerotinia sclerotiorum 1980 UF-70]EDO04564.1 hypothetical protein SS1G_07047 [Sclerotinia sclerotiorum 1980 UF-70]